MRRTHSARKQREYYAAGRSPDEIDGIARCWGRALKVGNSARIRLDELGQD